MLPTAAVSPYLRFSLRFRMSPGEIHGPRITYIPSINLIESGEGVLRTETGTVALRPGIQIYMSAGKKHAWEASRANPFIYRIVFFEWNYRERPGVVYPSDYISDPGDEMVTDFIEPPARHAIPETAIVEDMEAWNRRFAPIHTNYAVCSMERFPQCLRLQADFLLFLDHVMNEVCGPRPYHDKRVKAFMQAVEERPEDLEAGTIESWVRSAGMSRSHFHQLFKSQTGRTPNDYWSERRIERTIRDLIDTERTVTAIAELHGFDSVQSYIKLFRKVTGLRPGEFRRRNRIDS